MALLTNRTAGQTITAADINGIATAVNLYDPTFVGMANESAAGIATGNTGATNLANYNAWTTANPAKPIYIRAGIYDFTGTLVPKGNIFGAGPGVSVLRFPEQSIVSIQPANFTDLIFSDFEIRSTSTSTYNVPGTVGTSSSHHLILETGTGFLVRNVYANGGAVMGIHVRNCHRGSIINCKVYNTVRDGIHVTNGCTDVSVIGNQVIHSGDDGIALITYNTDSAQNERITVTGNTVWDSPRARGIVCEGGKDIVIGTNVVSNIYGVGGILLNSIGSVTTDTWALTNVLCHGNIITNVTAGDGIHVNGNNDDLVIQHNVIRQTSGNGINVNNGRVQIKNNSIDQASSNGITILAGTSSSTSYSVIKNNTIRRGTGQGIYCESNYMTCTGNEIVAPNTDSTGRDGMTFYNVAGLVCKGNRIDATVLNSGVVLSSVTSGQAWDNWVTGYTGSATYFASSPNVLTSMPDDATSVGGSLFYSYANDSTTTSTTIVDTGMMGTVQPGTYLVEGYLIDQSSLTTAGPRFGIGGTATATLTNFIVDQSVSTTARTTTIGTTINTTYGTNVGTATTSFSCNVYARVVVTVGGTLGLRWLMSATGTATLKAGSYAKITRVA